jgi:hypothetical protein
VFVNCPHTSATAISANQLLNNSILIPDQIYLRHWRRLNWTLSKSELCYDIRTVWHFVLVSGTSLEPMIRILLLSDGYSFVDVGWPSWWVSGSIVYNCCWATTKQSFLSQSSSGLLIILYFK